MARPALDNHRSQSCGIAGQIEFPREDILTADAKNDDGKSDDAGSEEEESDEEEDSDAEEIEERPVDWRDVLKAERRRSRRLKRQAFKVEFVEPVVVSMLEYNQFKDSALSVDDEHHVAEEHNQIPWYEQDYQELAWWEQPDLEEVGTFFCGFDIYWLLVHVVYTYSCYV